MSEFDFSEIPFHKSVSVIKTDSSGIFAIEKPAGVMTHPNQSGVAAAKNAIIVADYSLNQECFFIRKKDGSIFKIYVLNRLDSPTSGIVLLATNQIVADAVKKAFLKNMIQKTYYALSYGLIKENSGLWEDYLIKKKISKGLIVQIASPRPPAQIAITKYNVSKRGRILTPASSSPEMFVSLLKLEPKTGRTHQLRVQCASHGHPILGDIAYGLTKANQQISNIKIIPKNRLFLHAAGIVAKVSIGGNNITFSAFSPLPEEFTALIV